MSASLQGQVIAISDSPASTYHLRVAFASELRVLHVFDHSWPVLSGYSVRSRNLMAAQRRAGRLLSAVTGPLHQLDDPNAADAKLDGISYVRTPLQGRIATRALTARWPLAREWMVV